MIYVMGEQETGIVKLGTANNPCDRLKQIQAGYPRPLKLLLALPGGQPVEAAMHRYFAELRCSEREWFDFGEENAVYSVMCAWAKHHDLLDVPWSNSELADETEAEVVEVVEDKPELLPMREPRSAAFDVVYTYRDEDGVQLVFTGPTPEKPTDRWMFHINPDLTSWNQRLSFGQAALSLPSVLDLVELRGMLDREIKYAKDGGLWPTQPADSVENGIQAGMRKALS